jgi:hypothetical protein
MKRALLAFAVLALCATSSYAGGLADLLASYQVSPVTTVSSEPYVPYGTVPVRFAAFQQPAPTTANSSAATAATYMPPQPTITTNQAVRSTRGQCQSGNCDR